MGALTKFVPNRLSLGLERFMSRRSLMLSQAGQDFWVAGEAFNGKKGGYFLDIGAHDGLHISNTYLLESRYGWSGICIEANPDTFEQLQRNRRSRCLNVCLDRVEGEVDFVLRGVFGGIVGLDNKESNKGAERVVTMRTRPLLTVLEENHAPSIIDYLSIDVEGAEERVLGGFDFDRYTFRCITIERPSTQLHEQLEKCEYILIKKIPRLDSFYIHRSFTGEYKKNLFQFYKKRYVHWRWK